jgi:hypothetical protein
MEQLELLLTERELLKLDSENYIIPKMTEDPTAIFSMLKRYIRDFCKVNNLDLKKKFHNKNYKQLLGMFKGMKKHYNFSRDDTIID